jgi:hypothetical protein
MFVLFCRWCCVTSEGRKMMCQCFHLPLKILVRTTTRNYLIYHAFSATFSENITNVHCSPEHCDDLLNSSRFYGVFLFFVTNMHWSPKHCDDLLNSSRFYDVFPFFVTDVTWWIFMPRTLRRIPIFRHGCALMDIQAPNTVMYSCFSSRMCTDGYSNPEHCDNLLNSSKSSPQRYDI